MSDQGTAPDFTKTAEFEAAVSAATSAAVVRILAEMKEHRGADAPVSSSDRSFVESLAMAIADLNDQGSGRFRVAPEVLVERKKARDEMMSLIVKARAEGRAPVYTLTAKVFLDEVKVDPYWIGPDHGAYPTEIEWCLVPNEAMRPANDVAEGIYDAFIRSIGNTVKVVPEDVISITAGGLVVKGALGRRVIKQTGTGEPSESSPEGFGGMNIRGRGVPGRIVEKRVLGTVAAPARQTI